MIDGDRLTLELVAAALEAAKFGAKTADAEPGELIRTVAGEGYVPRDR